MKLLYLLVFFGFQLLGCRERVTPFDASGHLVDFGTGDAPLGNPVGLGMVHAGFTIIGCQTLDFSANTPHCTGPSPLRLVFVPLVAGAATFMWKFPGQGVSISISSDVSPTVEYSLSGTFEVDLAIGGTAGSASATGQIVVTTGALGQPCLRPSDCDATSGLVCFCGEGSDCPAPLQSGLCTRPCTGGSCGPSAKCVDFGRGAVGSGVAAVDAGTGVDAGTVDAGTSVDGGQAESYRQALCVPSCANDFDCRPGFLCRWLPVLAAGAESGGTFEFDRGCFPPGVFGDDGDACADASGAPDDARCLSGRCEPFGARGLCTSDCSEIGCPAGTDCVIMNRSMQRLCLRLCGADASCDDPLLACEMPGDGGLGFSATTNESAGATYCAPRRCMTADDCGPSGACVEDEGVSFCKLL
jgi:PKD repeat protein